MHRLGSVCVFCGSNSGTRSAYADAAADLGHALAHAGIRLVYGGGNVGLMGRVADAALQAGGEVVGVIPRFLMEREVGHQNLTALHVVESMHERKAMMAQLSDGFAVLPGGIGTLEEMFEVWTWQQLGLHPKPCGLLNVAGYFDALRQFIDHMVDEGFIRDQHRQALLTSDNVTDLIAGLNSRQPIAEVKRSLLDRA